MNTCTHLHTHKQASSNSTTCHHTIWAVILGGVTTDIEAEFHVLSEELLRMRDVHVKQKEREYQSVVDAVFGELQMDVKEFNKRSLATGNW